MKKKDKGLKFPCPHCLASITVDDDSARLTIAYGGSVTRQCKNCEKYYEIVLTVKGKQNGV